MSFVSIYLDERILRFTTAWFSPLWLNWHRLNKKMSYFLGTVDEVNIYFMWNIRFTFNIRLCHHVTLCDENIGFPHQTLLFFSVIIHGPNILKKTQCFLNVLAFIHSWNFQASCYMNKWMFRGNRCSINFVYPNQFKYYAIVVHL